MGIPLQKLQRNTTSAEFLEWRIFLNDEINEKEKIDYYLAQLALEVRRSYSKKPGKFKLDQFLIKFKTGAAAPNQQNTTPPKTKAEKKAHIEHSKAAWIAVVMKKPPKKP